MRNEKVQEIKKQIQILKNRNGNFIMDFYTGYNGPSACKKSCKSLNMMNTGYETIEEAVESGWII